MVRLSKLPICHYDSPDSTIALWQGRPISLASFNKHVQAIAAALPDKSFAVNLCNDRYLFLVSFFAVMLRKQTNLLPASKLPSVVAETTNEYEHTYIISDEDTVNADFILKANSLLNISDKYDDENIQIDGGHLAAVVFTSGSTGKPKPNMKTWGSLYRGAMLAIKRFDFKRQGIQGIVATVPPQHMYGLETSIVIPLLAGVTTICATTFYPADIEAAVNTIAGKCVLVTTPIHLKAFVDTGLTCRNIEFVISATAPMPVTLAKKTEKTFKTKLYEIYGASEFGSIATRHSVKESAWTLYDDMRLVSREHDVYISGPQFKNEVPIHDRIDVQDAQHFELMGRNSDLIKIAGKRISLGDLNQKLANIDGVVDGVFFVPQGDEESSRQRLSAFVVAPGMDKRQLLAELKKHIEPIFLPRPLLLVDELPRNATGKLPYKNLQGLYETLTTQ